MVSRRRKGSATIWDAAIRSTKTVRVSAILDGIKRR